MQPASPYLAYRNVPTHGPLAAASLAATARRATSPPSTPGCSVVVAASVQSPASGHTLGIAQASSPRTLPHTPTTATRALVGERSILSGWGTQSPPLAWADATEPREVSGCPLQARLQGGVSPQPSVQYSIGSPQKSSSLQALTTRLVTPRSSEKQLISSPCVSPQNHRLSLSASSPGSHAGSCCVTPRVPPGHCVLRAPAVPAASSSSSPSGQVCVRRIDMSLTSSPNAGSPQLQARTAAAAAAAVAAAAEPQADLRRQQCQHQQSSQQPQPATANLHANAAFAVTIADADNMSSSTESQMSEGEEERAAGKSRESLRESEASTQVPSDSAPDASRHNITGSGRREADRSSNSSSSRPASVLVKPGAAGPGAQAQGARAPSVSKVDSAESQPPKPMRMTVAPLRCSRGSRQPMPQQPVRPSLGSALGGKRSGAEQQGIADTTPRAEGGHTPKGAAAAAPPPGSGTTPRGCFSEGGSRRTSLTINPLSSAGRASQPITPVRRQPAVEKAPPAATATATAAATAAATSALPASLSAALSGKALSMRQATPVPAGRQTTPGRRASKGGGGGGSRSSSKEPSATRTASKERAMSKERSGSKERGPSKEMGPSLFTRRSSDLRNSSALRLRQEREGCQRVIMSQFERAHEAELHGGRSVSPCFGARSQPGSSLDFYALGKLLGKGAFGRVNVGVHKLTGALTAMKQCERKKIAEMQAKQCLAREVDILKKVHGHSNIIQLLEVIDTPTHVILVMEFAAGGDLARYVRHRRFLPEVPQGRMLFKQLVDGVAFLHDTCVVHRDLKLENLLLDSLGCLRIADFGVAVLLRDRQERISDSCGTPSYMAPEIFRDEPYCGIPVDAWSVGVVLYTMLCGRMPFKGDQQAELKRSICSGRFPPLPSSNSSEATELVDGLLQVDADRRLTMPGVLEHAWLRGVVNNAEAIYRGVRHCGWPQQPPSPTAALDHKVVLKGVAASGFPESHVESSLQSGAMNHGTATYHLLMQQLVRDRVSGQASEAEMQVGEAILAAQQECSNEAALT